MNANEYAKKIKEINKTEHKLKRLLSDVAIFWQDKITFTDDITCSIVPSEGICLLTDYKGGAHVIPTVFLGRLSDRVEISEDELFKYSV